MLMSQRISSEYFASQWFLTLFTYDLPIETIGGIIDIFIIDRFKALIKVGLAILSVLRDDLMNLEKEENYANS